MQIRRGWAGREASKRDNRSSWQVTQVALKRQQAAEDAIALGLRAVATGDHRVALPQGPIVGGFRLPLYDQEHSILFCNDSPLWGCYACFTFFFHKYYIGSRHKSKYYRFWFNKEKKCTIVWKLTQPNSFILFIHGVRFFQLIKEYAN